MPLIEGEQKHVLAAKRGMEILFGKYAIPKAHRPTFHAFIDRTADTFRERGTQMSQPEYNDLLSRIHTDIDLAYRQAHGGITLPDEQKIVTDLQQVTTKLASKFRWREE